MFLIALFGLKELSPKLRDQLMVSLNDRALIEARAAGLDPEKALQGSWRQMLRFDVVGPAFAIAVFLLLYYVLVAFLVVYFVTVLGYTEQKANALANWYWIANAITLVVTGLLSDKLRVRKPLMLVGAVIALSARRCSPRSARTPPPATTRSRCCSSSARPAAAWPTSPGWRASPRPWRSHNPAATATGLAIWGWIVRVVVTVSYAALILVVPATSTLVDHGPRAQEIAARYPQQVATLGAIDSGDALHAAEEPDRSGLRRRSRPHRPNSSRPGWRPIRPPRSSGCIQLTTPAHPADDLAFLAAHGSDVTKAQKDNPQQWQHWWWVCLAAQALFIPFIFVMAGRWSPRKARQDEHEHEQLVARELAALTER